MYNYLKRLYQLKNELNKLNSLLNEDYNVAYIDYMIEECLEKDIKPTEFYKRLEILHHTYKEMDYDLYHTIAIMLIYC